MNTHWTVIDLRDHRRVFHEKVGLPMERIAMTAVHGLVRYDSKGIFEVTMPTVQSASVNRNAEQDRDPPKGMPSGVAANPGLQGNAHLAEEEQSP